MKAMILAAGRGERMRPLTDQCPKPLLPVNGQPLIGYHLQRLAAIGVTDIVINVAHLAAQIVNTLGDGQDYGVRIQYSVEAEALETAGGIVQALPLLGEQPFIVLNGDVWIDYPLAKLLDCHPAQAHLILVDNPPHHPQGDFGLQQGLASCADQDCFTYSGLAVYHPDFFQDLPLGRHALGPLLRQKIAQQQVSAEHYDGYWLDVGTPQRLEELSDYLQRGS